MFFLFLLSRCFSRYHNDLFEFFQSFDNLFPSQFVNRLASSVFELCFFAESIKRSWSPELGNRVAFVSQLVTFLKRWRLHSLLFSSLSEKCLNEVQQKHAAKRSEHRSLHNSKDIISTVLSCNRCSCCFLSFALFYVSNFSTVPLEQSLFFSNSMVYEVVSMVFVLLVTGAWNSCWRLLNRMQLWILFTWYASLSLIISSFD